MAADGPSFQVGQTRINHREIPSNSAQFRGISRNFEEFWEFLSADRGERSVTGLARRVVALRA